MIKSIFRGNQWLSAEGATHPALRDDNPYDPILKGNLGFLKRKDHKETLVSLTWFP